MKNRSYLYLLLAFLIISCTTSPQEEKEIEQPMTKIKMVTTMGNITMQLYNKTPLHRDNFIKRVEQGAYDSIVFLLNP
ncbi:MAG: hypothetical protein ACI8Q1_003369 [Parvicella sp.]|jgi:hypothetical protein